MSFGDQARFFEGSRLLAEENHARGQFQAELRQVGRAGVLQRLRRFHHFQRVAHRVAQRLAHVGNQRLDLLVHGAGDAHHGLRQPARIHLLLHERAAAHLHIQHQRIHALRQFLRHDRRGNQRNRFHRAGDVAQRVKLAVGRRELVGLSDETQAQFGKLPLKLVAREVGAEAGNRFQLVQRAARVAQRPARHHRHHHACGGGQWRHHQAGLVAHPASGMLVHLDAGNGGKVRRFTGSQHALGQAADFAVGHARIEHGHEKRGHLVVRYLAGGVAIHQKFNFLRGQLGPVALALDQVNCTHYETLRLASPSYQSKVGYRGGACFSLPTPACGRIFSRASVESS